MYNVANMSNAFQKNKRNLTSLELPSATRSALRRLKKNHGINHTAAVARGVSLLEKTLTLPLVGTIHN